MPSIKAVEHPVEKSGAFFNTYPNKKNSWNDRKEYIPIYFLHLDVAGKIIFFFKLFDEKL